MRKSTRLIALMLATVMVTATAISGCGKKNNGGGSHQGGNANGISTDVPLKIGVVKKGYGDEFAYKLAEAFEKKTGIETVVEKSSSAVAWVDTALKSGAKNNDLDIIFDINSNIMKAVATKAYVSGYDRCYADLSDIYDSKLEGYDTDKTLKEMLFDYSLKACTWGGEEEGYGDGKQYAVNWASGIEGLVYNHGLFEKYNLSVPKTSNELLALLSKMQELNKGSYAQNKDGYTTYPFVYAGDNDYTKYLTTVWWAQYDGIDSFENCLQAKNAGGVYSAEAIKSAGRLSALKILEKIIGAKTGNCSSDCSSLNFTNAQVLFLDEQAFMIPTGDWLEREMEANFEGELNIKFMPIPVNSDIIKNCKTVTTDEQLSEVISYIDGDIAEKPSYVSDEDFEYIRSARSMYMNEGGQHVAYIPAYSNNLAAAKMFLQFMLSKEGQEIMLQYSYGNMAPLNVDATTMEYAKELSPFQQSKLELYNAMGGMTLVGLNYVHPMNYAGGWNITPSWNESMGVEAHLDTYKSAMDIWKKDYENAVKNWELTISKSGMSN